MATLKDIINDLNLKVITEVNDDSREIEDCCVCDLLSWVMAKGSENMAWITVQTNLNVIAVASLHDFTCVIIPENIEIPDNTILKANDEGVVVLSSNKTAYEICCGLASMGIGK